MYGQTLHIMYVWKPKQTDEQFYIKEFDGILYNYGTKLITSLFDLKGKQVPS